MASARRSSTTTSLLGIFRTAVKKVRFVLSFSATRWILSSIVGSRLTADGATPRRLSFGAARPPSLLDFDGSVIVSPAWTSGAPSRSASLGPPPPPRTVSRTSSEASSGFTVPELKKFRR
ncbi:hypothetical protein GUJ93_ZPchr0008g11542 [Zizania palustris]|uniref:Uncharacterized protein n=1 Tax=Zizania palustris TaxID=103762 RepID=A0A8J5RIW3_ZIZPA|nr:hypothetical protein GUJ93_ZPchr0008g11542 [Zizania palustris]